MPQEKLDTGSRPEETPVAAPAVWPLLLILLLLFLFPFFYDLAQWLSGRIGWR